MSLCKDVIQLYQHLHSCFSTSGDFFYKLCLFCVMSWVFTDTEYSVVTAVKKLQHNGFHAHYTIT